MFREGQEIGPYALIRKLGKGGFGEVWLAENENQLFAVKLPHKDQVDWKQITQEIGLWTLCGKHPNLMPLVGARNFNGQIAIISEYATDGSLEDLLRQKGKLAIEEAVKITIGILEGLQHLHESGIIHRDLKPANILLDGKTPRLADFGISRIITADSLSETISGTWAYMAPECFDGKRNVQTDIWSVGVILYRMLAGNLPFPQKEQTALIGSIIMSEPNQLSDEIDAVVKGLLTKTLSKNSLDRPDIYSLLFDLRNYIDDFKGFLNHLNQREKILLAREEVERESQIEIIETSELIPYRKGSKWGFCDSEKNILIEPKYDEAYPFVEGMSLVKLNDKHGFINRTGQEIIEIRYDDANHFSEGLAMACLDDSFGYLDKNGREVIDFDYGKASNFSEGLAYADWDNDFNSYGGLFINKSGEEVFEIIHYFISDFTEGLCCVMSDDQYGFINKAGETVISLIYDNASPFSEGLARVIKDRKIGFINKKGKKVHEIKYSNASDFIGGIALVEYEQRKFFINKLGDEISIPSLKKYDDMDYFDNELIRVKTSTGNYLRGKFGFINKSGNEVIPVKYDWTDYEFVSNVIKVKLDNKYFYIRNDGTEYFQD